MDVGGGACLMDYLGQIEDPRRRSNGTRHVLREVLAVAICAMLSNVETFEDIALWGQLKLPWLRRLSRSSDGQPSGNTMQFSLPTPNQLRTLAVAPLTAVGALAALFPLILLDTSIPFDDLIGQYRWAAQFHESLFEGNWYPRWAPRDNMGLGLPSFLYYYPAYYYVTALPHYFSVDLWLSMKIVIFLCFWATGFIAHGFLISMGATERMAIMGALALQFSPQPLLVLFHYGALPWAASFPLLILVTRFALQYDPARLSFRIAFAFAALCLTHLLTAFMLLVAFLPIGVQQLYRHRSNWRHLVNMTLPWLAGVALAAPYIVPAVFTTDLLIPGFVNTGERWYRNFVLPFAIAEGYPVRWPLVQIYLPIATLGVIAAAGLLWWRIRGSSERADRGGQLLLMAIVAFFFSTEFSYPIWDSLSLLRMLQLPTRFVFVSSAMAILAVSLLYTGRTSDRVRGAGALTALAFSVALAVAMLVQILSSGARLGYSGEDLAIEQHRHFHFVPKTRSNGWIDYVSAGGLMGYCKRRELHCEIVIESSETRKWKISASAPSNVLLPVLQFPWWRVQIDDQAVQHSTDLNSGLVGILIPEGEHIIRLSRSLLPAEWAGYVVGVIACVLIVGQRVLLGLRARLRRPSPIASYAVARLWSGGRGRECDGSGRHEIEATSDRIG